MTLIEELKALDLASGEYNNIYRRVLEYIEKLEEYRWMHEGLEK